VDVFKEMLDKIGTMDLEANTEKTEATVKHQEVIKEQPRWKLSTLGPDQSSPHHLIPTLKDPS
jgi:hypothetical protein